MGKETMNKLKQLEEKIIEANPSIKDLVFGCRLITPKREIVTYLCDGFEDRKRENPTKKVFSNYDRKDVEVPIERSNFKYDTVCQKKDGSKYYLAFSSEDKIIGREITLEDVLMTIHKKYDFYNKPNQPEISIAIDDLVNIEWDLTKPLSSQPPEVINLLYKLIKEI